MFVDVTVIASCRRTGGGPSDLQMDLPDNAQKCAYGDGIYPNLSHIRCRDNQQDGMASIRIANEWNFGTTSNLYPFTPKQVEGTAKASQAYNIKEYLFNFARAILH